MIPLFLITKCVSDILCVCVCVSVLLHLSVYNYLSSSDVVAVFRSALAEGRHFLLPFD